MAESFSNKLARAVGVVSTSSAGTIGPLGNLITGVSTAGLTAGDLVDNIHYIAGTKILNFGNSPSHVVCDRNSTNTASASGQNVKFLAPTEIYTSPGGTKSIIIGGTFANNTTSQVNLWVAMYDNSVTTQVGIAQKIPVPSGSSFVIADTGKTLLEASDEIRVFSDTANAIDVSLSILTGVN